MAKQMGAWAIVFAVVLLSQSLWADAFVVKAGEPLTITDENVGEFAGGLTFEDAEGVVTFTTTAAPTMSIAGAGTLVKDNAANWTLATAQTGFTGTWDFKGGLAELTVEGGAGKVDASGVGPIYVRSGATFKISVATHMMYREFRLAGTGTDGKGALFCNVQDTTGLISLLRLEEDALMRSDKLWFLQQASGGPTAQVDLNGKTLSVDGSAVVYLINGKTVNGGCVRVVKKTTLSHRGAFMFDAQTELRFEDGSTYMIFNDSAPQVAKLVAEGGLRMYHVHQFHASSTSGKPVPCPQDGSKNNWLGEICLTNQASLLKLGNGASDDLGETLTIGGPLTGPGSISVFGYDDKFGRVILSCPSNAFTGTLTVGAPTASVETGWLEASHSNAIPNYANLKLDNGMLMLRPGADGWSWDADAVTRLVAQADGVGAGAPVLDTSACEDGRLVLQGPALDAVESRREIATVGHIGEGDVTVVGPVTNPVCYRALGGAVRFTGEGPIVVTPRNSNCSGSWLQRTDGEVLFDNARGVFFNSYPSYVGEAYGAPQLTFRNSTLCQTYDYPSHAGGQNDALVIGGNGWRGRMVVEGDSVVTGKFVMAAWSAAAQGSIIQKGGEVVVCGTTNDNNYASDLATSGHGYYELRSGTAKFLGYNRIGGYGSMVVAQYGGTFALTNYPGMSGAFFNAPAGGGGKSHLYVRSGTFRVVGNLLLGRYGESALTLDGPDARYSAQNDCVSWGYSDTVSSVNVNDGATLQANFGSRFTKGEYLGKYNYVPKMYLNVNGGRVRFTGDGGGRGGGAFGRVFEDCTDAQYPGVTRVTVYEKGLVYEAPSSTSNLLHPVLKPTGKGIVRIPWTPVSGLSVSPYVTITGDGTGAAAFAEFDSDTGTVTGIRIVSRGCDYTWAKAKVLVGMNGAKSSAPSNEWLEIDCELEENDLLPPGGFAKEGEGTLVLHATNTYEGVTAVNGGVLQLAADDVISAKSELSLGGGTLKLGNLHQTFAGLRGTGGTVTGGDLKIVPPNGVWEISAKRFLDRESSAVAGTLDLTAVREIRIVDTELLDADAEALRRLNLFSATTVVWPDSLTITGPDGWRLVRKPNALGFGYAKGTMLLVR